MEETVAELEGKMSTCKPFQRVTIQRQIEQARSKYAHMEMKMTETMLKNMAVKHNKIDTRRDRFQNKRLDKISKIEKKYDGEEPKPKKAKK